MTNSSSAAWAWTPYDDNVLNYPENGDVWFDHAYPPNLELQPGEFGFSTHHMGCGLGIVDWGLGTLNFERGGWNRSRRYRGRQ